MILNSRSLSILDSVMKYLPTQAYKSYANYTNLKSRKKKLIKIIHKMIQ